MTAGSILAFAAASLLGACAIFPDDPRASDAVKTAAAATEIAAKTCKPYPYVTEGGSWAAVLHDGVWDVHFHLRGNAVQC